MDNSIDNGETTPELAPALTKKPYDKPVLKRLGALRELTGRNAIPGNPDGRPGRRTGRNAQLRVDG